MQKHGGNIRAFAQEIGCNEDEVIDLSSNINVVKPKIDIDFNQINISSYPTYDKLYQAIATQYKLKSSQIELFNGATVGIHTLFRELKLKHCTLYAPLYGEYAHSAKSYGYEIELINRFTNLDQEVKENSFVIFVNPSTPDGKFYNIESLMKRWIDKNCTILIDESFLDFTPYESAIQYIEHYDKLYILKSMTKFYSSAGMRIGAIFSNRNSIKELNAKEPLWKISEFDSQYLQSALRDKNFIQRSNQINRQHYQQTIDILIKKPWVKKIYPSSVNFILIELQQITSQELQEALHPYKVMIRECGNFDFLDNHFVRIAIKTEKGIDILKRFHYNSIKKG
jgi:threonine-phosphate decarboxylase